MICYNNSVNDQALTVSVILEGTRCVIEQYDEYYRVIIKHCENGSKVLVKLIDYGNEIVVDTIIIIRN
ncbi:unnamed protein product [Rotaria socialis]|uniref:Tudor domain-containing protein n=1 Tax=Rotaria socialis TaxID=392032 RepID=A0A817VEL5_9BILA|nr:unnamed protein product [Rotaria socialis]CAF3478170.1 unnamed protein product [Rotaria socialis]CAF4245825.1 unnamed protein product [Rotaria socialis]CAF4673695.1 unnamed protein product [Rotaria socialis]